MNGSWARGLFVGSVVLNAVTLGWSALALPPRVASHFAASGVADGWSSRTSYLVLMAVVLVAVVLAMPWCARLVDVGDGTWINVAHKDYWLQPAHRPELRRRLTSDLQILAALTGTLLAAMQWLTIRANQMPHPAMGVTAWVLLGLYLVAVIALLIAMPRHYAVPTTENDAPGRHL